VPIEQAVVRPQVQIWVIEQQPHWNGPEFLAGFVSCRFSEELVQWVQHPAVLVLHLAGQGEFIVFFWKSFAVAFYDFADRDATDRWWRERQSLEHGVSFELNELRESAVFWDCLKATVWG
jgi:hypothetical protein